MSDVVVVPFRQPRAEVATVADVSPSAVARSEVSTRFIDAIVSGCAWMPQAMAFLAARDPEVFAMLVPRFPELEASLESALAAVRGATAEG